MFIFIRFQNTRLAATQEKKLAFIPRGEYEERVDWFKWPFNS